MPRLELRCQLVIFVRVFPLHSHNILNLLIGLASPHFHVIFNYNFSTLMLLRNGIMISNQEILCKDKFISLTYDNDEFNLLSTFSDSIKYYSATTENEGDVSTTIIISNSKNHNITKNANNFNTNNNTIMLVCKGDEN